jgi:hypothetical protein
MYVVWKKNLQRWIRNNGEYPEESGVAILAGMYYICFRNIIKSLVVFAV